MSLFLIIALAIGIVLISLPVTFKPDKEKDSTQDKAISGSNKFEIRDNTKEAA